MKLKIFVYFKEYLVASLLFSNEQKTLYPPTNKKPYILDAWMELTKRPMFGITLPESELQVSTYVVDVFFFYVEPKNDIWVVNR